MCGIAGVARTEPTGVPEAMLVRMGEAIRHRGPDGAGVYAGSRVGLSHVRLSIIDVDGGAQPIANEDGRVLIVFNGEIYNYLELREELVSRGHQFRTRSDTEVLVHGYEEWGRSGLLSRLNGMFAFAIYDRRDDSLFLARDRFGKRPLFYAERAGSLYFGSEVKAIFASGEVPAALDPAGLDEVFTFWGARAPRTPFLGVSQLQPGGYAVWRDGRLRTTRYWAPSYGDEAPAEAADVLDRLGELMKSSVELRMRADVPVGGYLSGGLDSSITCALAATMTPHDLRTFSVTFADPQFDESAFQQVVAGAVRSRHLVQHITQGDIAAVFPEVVRHTETPLVRTAPAPLYLLSRLTRENGIKVVLSGEGSDEMFLGYDLFKETKVRQFCLRQPGSKLRPRLFDRLYPYLQGGNGRGGEFWRKFFLTAGSPDDPLFSHLPRFLLTSRIKEFYSAEMRLALGGTDVMDELRQSLPEEFARWSPLNRAAYLEVETLLSSYLLSSQGDRMSMANSVEGRCPFLDVRLAAFAAGLPTGSKLRGLREKDVLRRWSASVVPAVVNDRPKQPYRAPDAPAFFAGRAPEYVEELLSAESLRASGVFCPVAVSGLVRRCRAGRATGFGENQALVAILSTQLWHRQFIAGDTASASGAAPRPSRFTLSTRRGDAAAVA